MHGSFHFGLFTSDVLINCFRGELSCAHREALKTSKRENYAMIYESESARAKLDRSVRPMMGEIYAQLLEDLKQGNRYSPIFTHHIDYVNQTHYPREVPYESTEPNQMVVDYIASMTDDYFIDLYNILFPDSPYRVRYRGYFEEMRDRHV